MRIKHHKTFTNIIRKGFLSNSSLNQKFKQRFKLFIDSPLDPTLKDHALTGDLVGHRSFSITGDIRVVYKIEQDTIILMDIGTHAQVYKM